MKTVKTLTVQGLVNLFHEYGIPCSAPTLAAAIEAGYFPFAVGIRRQDAVYMIFERDARAWLDARAE